MSTEITIELDDVHATIYNRLCEEHGAENVTRDIQALVQQQLYQSNYGETNA